MITHWVQAGVEHVAVNESGAVCGRLIPLNDEFITQAIKRPENGAQSVRVALLSDKHKAKDQKRSEQRREAKRNVSRKLPQVGQTVTKWQRRESL